MGSNIPGAHMKPFGAPLNLHSVKRITEVSSGHGEQVKQVSLIYANMPDGHAPQFVFDSGVHSESVSLSGSHTVHGWQRYTFSETERTE